MTNQRPRVFFGWWVVATAALGLCLGAAPIIVYAFGVFFKPLSEEYHAGRGAISLAFTLQNLAAALSAPLTGRLVDRFGARRVILPGTAIFGIILLSSKLIGGELWHFYLFLAVLGIIHGCTSPVSYSVVVSHWFNRRRGLGLGLMMLGIGVGAIGMPSAAQRLITMFGWRAAYAGDLLPTAAHLGAAWITGFDLYPVDTLAAKKAFLREAIEQRALVFFDHDPAIAAGFITEQDGKVSIQPA